MAATLLCDHARAASAEDPFGLAARIFQACCRDAHVPGLLFGAVIADRRVHVGTVGVQDLQSHRPVTPDTLFRSASMRQAFAALTWLQLRDAGRVPPDALAEHTDVLWGERQSPLPEQGFTRLLRRGVPFTCASAMRARDLAKPGSRPGSCDTSMALVAAGALTGDFPWRCRHGHVHGALQLAPMLPPGIHKLALDVEP